MSVSDDLYAALLGAHEGLGPDDSAALNRALILLLMDALDDEATAASCLRRARDAVGPDLSHPGDVP